MTNRGIVRMHAPASLTNYLREHYGELDDPDDLIGVEIPITVLVGEDDDVDGQEALDMARYTYNENDQHPLHDPRWAEQFLEQPDLWCDASGTYIEVIEMESSHAQNAIVSVLKMAPAIALAVALGGDIQPDGIPHEERLAMVADAPKARAWLLTTPLLKGLLVRASHSTAGQAPWATRRRLIRAQIR